MKKLIYKLLIFILLPVTVICVVYKITNNSRRFISTGELGFDKPGELYRYFKDITTPIGIDEPGYSTGYRFYEFNKAKRISKRFKSTLDVYPWVQRGPGNVGGRTRGLIVDPDDNTWQTWYAGSASGGIWKTSDAGTTWINLTEDFPNLATSTITMAESNHNIIYAGILQQHEVGLYLSQFIWKISGRNVPTIVRQAGHS